MSLGLPGHLAAGVVNSGITRGAHAVAAVSLLSALAAFGIFWVSSSTRGSAVVVVVVIIVMALLLTALHLRNTVWLAVLYLAAGAAGVAVAVTVVLTASPSARPAGDYLVALLQIATVMVGGARGPSRLGVVLTIIGYGTAVLGTLIGALVVGGEPQVVPIVPLSAVLIVLIFAVTAATRRAARVAQPRIFRAARDEKMSEVRSAVETRAAALLHDTVLGSLAAITTIPAGPLPDNLRKRIRSDLEAIVGQDWTERAVSTEGSTQTATIDAALEAADIVGLSVEVTGDAAHLNRLDGKVADSLALAVRQLLVNVRLHSGTSAAEVVIFGDATTVSLMVIDAGEGFDPSAVAADRLGLRNSVRGRLAAVGGDVKVWSTPGKGTSVMVTVPAGGSTDVSDRDVMEVAR